jgi:hypothetical protein
MLNDVKNVVTARQTVGHGEIALYRQVFEIECKLSVRKQCTKSVWESNLNGNSVETERRSWALCWPEVSRWGSFPMESAMGAKD